MKPNLKDPKVVFGIIAVVLLLGYLLSRGSSGTTTTTGGVNRQQEFANAMTLQAADSAQKNTLVQALLAYDKSAKDFALGSNTLTASTALEKSRISNAYLLGGRSLDLQGRTLDAQTQVNLAGINSAQTVALAQDSTSLKTATMKNQTDQQNGVLNFFGNLIGGILGFFTGRK